MLKPALTLKMVKENMFIHQSLSHRVIPRESTGSAYIGFLDLDAGESGMRPRVKAPGSGAEALERSWFSLPRRHNSAAGKGRGCVGRGKGSREAP